MIQQHFSERPLDSGKALDWVAIRAIPICEGGEPLVRLADSARMRVDSAYFRMGVEGADEAVFVRQSVSRMLYDAAQKLPEHLGLAVLDGWRPAVVQRALRRQIRAEIVRQHPTLPETEVTQLLNQFAADPETPDFHLPHQTGGSVDVTLFDRRNGAVLDMGGAFDEPGEVSYSLAYENTTHPACAHRRILIHTMLQTGFTNLPTEWWHFDFGNQNWAFFSDATQAQYAATQP